jgi:KipI family sensor histidine kinase inhibitor
VEAAVPKRPAETGERLRAGVRLRDVRDGAILIEYPELSDEQANLGARSLARRLRSRAGSGLRDAVPGARTLLVLFDPARLRRERLAEEIEREGSLDPREEGPSRRIRIPVVYDGEDLAELSRERGLSTEEFVRRHAAGSYRVAFIGFAPGFPYLVGLPPELSAARLSAPRTRVPAGSVAIGGSYTGIYPAEMPGGWRLIGRTAVVLFDGDADPPSLLSPGDEVRFEGVGAQRPLPAPARVGARPPAGRCVFRVREPGVFTSIQGAPRFGLGSWGVPAGGAMDVASLARANGLVGNATGAPALEISRVGPALEALEPSRVAVSGADCSVELGGRPVSSGTAFSVERGERLRLGRTKNGARAYLAIRGGLAASGRAPTATRRLQAEDEIRLAEGPSLDGQTMPSDPAAEPCLRVILGPQSAHFSEAAVERLLSTVWRVSQESDRRGLRLEGGRLEHLPAPEIAPEGTVYGSIQVPANGLPIVLGADGPVTGGYPKIATVVEADLPSLGQAEPGSALRFRAVSLAEALSARRGLGGRH